MNYNPLIVTAFFKSHGIAAPLFEHQFYRGRKWRFDMAWPERFLALECQGGIWSQGRHVRGAALLKEWEKLNFAATLGYRFIFCQPRDLLTAETAKTIKAALEWRPSLGTFEQFLEVVK